MGLGDMTSADWNTFAILKEADKCQYYNKGMCDDPVNFEGNDQSPVQCGGCAKGAKY